MRTVGIDIGTTTISVVVIDNQSYLPERKYTINSESFVPGNYPWERMQDVRIIVSKVNQILEKILSNYNDISAIGLTGQMHGIVYTDKNGLAVSPLYTWQDGRANQPDSRGRSICSILSEDWGISVPVGYGMATHLYNVKKGLVPEDAISFCTIADYMGMVLTKRITPRIHISQAASLGLYDYEKMGFMCEVIAGFGADPAILPQITAELEPLGVYRAIPVSVSLGDNQASFLGTVRNGADTVLVNVGTGSQISIVSGSSYKIPGIESRPLTKNLYLLVGAAICGGAAYAALEQFFHEYASAAGAPEVPQFDVMEQFLTQQKNPGEAWKIQTTFLGTRVNPEETGSISGIRMANFHPASMIRGVLNGMADELHSLYHTIENTTGITKSKLLASGNGVRKNIFLQNILAEYFNLPLEVAQVEEEAAVGAAISALVTIGETSVEEHLKL